MVENENPEITPHLHDQFIFDKDVKVIHLEKIVFSTNSTGLTRYLYEIKKEP